MKRAVVSFCRMNPPTIGHYRLIQKVCGIANNTGAVPMIFLSHTEDCRKNPLSYDAKAEFLSRATGGVVCPDPSRQVNSIIEMMEFVARDFESVIVVCGSDRLESYKEKLTKYNGDLYHVADLQFSSAGDRSDDPSDPTSWASASRLREAILNNDMQTADLIAFPGTSREMFAQVREKLYNGKTVKRSTRG